GQTIRHSTNNGVMNGFLVDSASFIEPHNAPATPFTVPSGKIFVITSYGVANLSTNYNGNSTITVNGIEANLTDGSAFIVSGGSTVNQMSGYRANGYLIDSSSFIFEPGYVNGNQVLTLKGDTLGITDGNELKLPSIWTEKDSIATFNKKAVGIGTSQPHPSAALEVKSTTKGFLPPKMTKTHYDSIPSPAQGLLIYRTDTIPGLYMYQDSTWNKIEIQKNGSSNKTLIYTSDGF
ncbi:MAG: hypothetical protein KDC83_13430, partial [Flavobacteriales bacterium]|nr:hypothetical protein [Flavobacteriales bacterium]